ncbi:dihydrofolate reductase family protein [Candidatus Halobonum tyrrellensis]|uniref:5-amino-6-(5-phosphoribosylamino)uracil reductase n=1 Tax=Candidatus Halobonum tyrrellensis G22 TaxID=1324957 RepID=V4GRG4_9EURY|nr:dihydrofolate reductase family protein [Candidatus Halobonum tyrrellensis]ESP87651.1 5-amino-6-(5-phosphoribosylamino)uracil reductase [Candidatus Halobonum tyrrellensis G22]
MYVHVNAAVSADGKLSSRRRDQVAISGAADFDRVDRIRAAADAVMVGVGTVLADDPQLTVDEEDRRVHRLRNGRPGNPARVVADSRARTPPDARVLDDAAETYVLVTDRADPDAVDALDDAGAEVVVVGADGRDPEDGRAGADDGASGDGDASGNDSAGRDADGGDGASGRVDLSAALAELGDRGVDRLMVEGGGELIFSLFAAGLVDELTLYVGSLLVGGRDAPTLADGEGFVDGFADLELVEVERLDDGVLLSYRV